MFPDLFFWGWDGHRAGLLLGLPLKTMDTIAELDHTWVSTLKKTVTMYE